MFVAIESMARVMMEERLRKASCGGRGMAEWCALEFRQERRHG